MRKKALVSFSSFIADRKDALARMKREVAQFAAAKEMFAPAYGLVNQVAKAAALDGDSHVYAEPEVYVRWDGDDADLTLRAYVTLYKVESLKEGRVPFVLEQANKLGFDFDTTSDYASENYAERTYRSNLKVGAVQVKLNITASIKDDAENCRKVQVGVETKQVPKFEIVCN